MHTIEKELDRILRLISCIRNSQISYKRPVEPLRIIRDFNRVFKYDIRNIIFLTKEEILEFELNPQYKEDILTQEQKDFRNKNEFIDFGQYLLDHNLTEEEFFNKQKQELIKLLPTQYELFVLNRESNGINPFAYKKKKVIKPFFKKDNILRLKKENRQKAKEIIKSRIHKTA